MENQETLRIIRSVQTDLMTVSASMAENERGQQNLKIAMEKLKELANGLEPTGD